MSVGDAPFRALMSYSSCALPTMKSPLGTPNSAGMFAMAGFVAVSCSSATAEARVEKALKAAVVGSTGMLSEHALARQRAAARNTLGDLLKTSGGGRAAAAGGAPRVRGTPSAGYWCLDEGLGVPRAHALVQSWRSRK